MCFVFLQEHPNIFSNLLVNKTNFNLISRSHFFFFWPNLSSVIDFCNTLIYIALLILPKVGNLEYISIEKHNFCVVQKYIKTFSVT